MIVKKTLSIFIAAMLIICALLGICAAATEGNTPSPDSGSQEFSDTGSAKVDVVASYQPKYNIKADILWSDMKFYFILHDGKWSNQKHEISVTNNSTDTTLITELTFTPEAGFEGAFYTKDENAPYYTQILNDSIVIPNKKSDSNAPQQKYYFAMTGGALTSEGQRMGNISIKIRPEYATAEVADYTALKVALQYDYIKKIILTQDINMNPEVMKEVDQATWYVDAGHLTLEVDHDITIDMNGHKIYTSYAHKDYSVDLFQYGLLSNEGTIAAVFGIADGVTCNIMNGSILLDDTRGRFAITAGENSTLNMINVTADELRFKNAGKTNVTDCTFTFNSGSREEPPSIFMSASQDSALQFSGKVNVGGAIEDQTVKCYAGEYGFDPTAYVDANRFIITENSGTSPTTWTVTD